MNLGFVGVALTFLFLGYIIGRSRVTRRLYRLLRRRATRTEQQSPNGPDGVEKLPDGEYHIRIEGREWRYSDDGCFRFPSGQSVWCGHPDFGVCMNAVRRYEEDIAEAARKAKYAAERGLITAIEVPQRKWRYKDLESHCGVS